MPNLSDAKGTLDKLTGWVKGQGKKQQSRKAPWAWITTLLVGAVALFAVGFMYWRSWKQGRALAKLKHERDVVEQNKARAEVTDAMAVNEKKIRTHSLEIERSKHRIKRLDVDLGKITDETIETHEKIDLLKNWRDVDRYLDDNNDDSGPSPGAA